MPTELSPNILTVDVEDWFHILEADGAAPGRDAWPGLESRVESSCGRLLDCFAAARAHATFFVVGWIAARHPELVRRIAGAGHEVASHSFWHEVVRRHDRVSLAADLEASRKLLEDLSGQRVEGFRAAGNSITPAEAWAFDAIFAAGFRYDASLCPARSSHGGFPSPFRGPHLVRCAAGELIEIPSASIGLGRWRIPYGGGGYLRLFPGWLVRLAIALDNSAGRPSNVYVHPREVDVEQPRLALPPLRRFKYYVGLATTERKLAALLASGRWIGVRRWIAERRPDLYGKVLDVRELAARPRPAPDPTRVPPAPSLALGADAGG